MFYRFTVPRATCIYFLAQFQFWRGNVALCLGNCFFCQVPASVLLAMGQIDIANLPLSDL